MEDPNFFTLHQFIILLVEWLRSVIFEMKSWWYFIIVNKTWSKEINVGTNLTFQIRTMSIKFKMYDAQKITGRSQVGSWTWNTQ